LTDSILAADLASQGYLVLCIDHPGESPYLALPGGGGISGPPPTPVNGNLTDAYVEGVYDLRVSDMKALIDAYPTLGEEFGAPSFQHGPRYLGVGHSIGGATIAGVMGTEDSIIGGVNLDGTFFGDARDLKRPFLLMHEPQHNLTMDKTWSNWEDAQSFAWWEVLDVLGAAHYDFTDLPMLYSLLDVQGPPEIVGPINKYRMRNITTTFVETFFDMVVLGKDASGLLDGKLPNKDWPEVDRLARNTNA
jgi:hypothetical protein